MIRQIVPRYVAEKSYHGPLSEIPSDGKAGLQHLRRRVCLEPGISFRVPLRISPIYCYVIVRGLAILWNRRAIFPKIDRLMAWSGCKADSCPDL